MSSFLKALVFSVAPAVILAITSIVLGFINADFSSSPASPKNDVIDSIMEFTMVASLIIAVVAVVLVISQISALNILSDLFLQTIPLITFLCWTFLIPVASFSFAKGMFSNKVTGSIIFLGKPSTERKSVFSGLLTLVAFLSVLGNMLMIAIGTSDSRPSYIFLGLLGLGMSIFIILLVQALCFRMTYSIPF